jgi:hypothetical protein
MDQASDLPKPAAGRLQGCLSFVGFIAVVLLAIILIVSLLCFLQVEFEIFGKPQRSPWG